MNARPQEASRFELAVFPCEPRPRFVALASAAATQKTVVNRRRREGLAAATGDAAVDNLTGKGQGTMMKALRDPWPAIRRHRLNSLVTRVGRRLYRSHRFLILTRKLDETLPQQTAGFVTFRVATPADLDRLPQSRFGGRAAKHRQYVQNDGDFLFVAERDEQIVATLRYSCALPSVLRDGHGLVSNVMSLTAGQVWGADAFCLPEYRNKGISRELLVFALRWLAQRGFTEAFGTVAITNLASLRMSLNVGSRIVCYVSIVRVLSWPRIRVSTSLPRRLDQKLTGRLQSPTGAIIMRP